VKKRISTENLAFGMYIAELDRPWAETPFAFQGFVLKTQAQLGVLRKYCSAVYIDPERGADSGEQGAPRPRAGASAPVFNLHGTVNYRVAQAIESEFPRARAALASGSAAVEEAYRTLRIQGEIDGRVLTDAISTMTDSLVEMPDALALVSQLAVKGPRLRTRALNSSIYMIVFGRYLGHSREQLELMGLVGLLQDIGKLRLPAALLEKDGPYSARETELARTHVDHIDGMLRGCRGLPSRVAALAALHHERQDGSGYPRGLRGAEIGLIGSMAAIVDSFDAMTTPRPFPVQLSVTQAYAVLYKQRGSAYHSALVEEFCRCFGVFPVGCPVELNSGEVGIVTAQHPVKRLQPRVMLVADAAGNPMWPHKILDLAREPKMSAEEPYRIRRTLNFGAVAVEPAEFLPV
jgi:HD-GYP domain-containing protein (c-di-GMP phosphodiesterase class II)